MSRHDVTEATDQGWTYLSTSLDDVYQILIKAATDSTNALHCIVLALGGTRVPETVSEVGALSGINP